MLRLVGGRRWVEALHISTAPDNEGYVAAGIEGNALVATSPPMPWKSSLSALQDYLAHLKLSARVYSMEEDGG